MQPPAHDAALGPLESHAWCAARRRRTLRHADGSAVKRCCWRCALGLQPKGGGLSKGYQFRGARREAGAWQDYGRTTGTLMSCADIGRPAMGLPGVKARCCACVSSPWREGTREVVGFLTAPPARVTD